ncbi:Two component system response regulator/histidine kinase, PAS domain-containing [Desulfonema limicola]|uniref:histidine kinase n=1 Tax=Desulfonema limicola TaxID=45656 RepID=A0A975BAC2_9BACT|nr:response regulator [Desulfonema limicola]QTA81579.1 Two component system response regulator/histidine kinase, PAS domain-containing [Desulfonema limicola]
MNRLNLRNKILIPITLLVIIAFSLIITMYISHFTEVLKKNADILAQQTALLDINKEQSELISKKINQIISEESMNLTIWSAGIGLFFILILMSLIFVISGVIVKPLYKLVTVSLSLSNGHFDTRINLDSSDEFGIAARYIDKAFDIVIEKMFWYERILDGIPFPVSVTDMDMKWTFINRKAELILKKNRKALIGKKCSQWNKDICNTENCGINLLSRGITESSFIRNETKKHFRVETAWLSDKKGEKIGHIEVVRDITKAAELRKKTEDRNWIQTGETQLNHLIHGEHDIPVLGKNIITFICKYVNAFTGTFYIMDHENSVLQLKASYAFTNRKNIACEFKPGQGIVGQAALEQETIIITNIPDDYITIDSALGYSAPKNIIVIPFIFRSRVQGVIELGAFHEFTELEKEFLDKAVRYIGVVINTAVAGAEMKELLIKTQNQTEELQVQQEELRQSNEELEEQTRALKKSEAKLQAQQEELRVINEELEERTKDLEKQHKFIQQKNHDLEKAQDEIQQKARALESASKYKSEFMANMSHELRTPLNSILILSQLLSNNKEQTLTEKQVEFAETIYSSGADLLSLINEILDLSKVEAGKLDIVLEEMNLKELIEDVRRTFGQIAAQKDIALNVNIDSSLPDFIQTDTKRVWQIMKNLLSNAFKFTEKGEVNLNIFKPDQDIVSANKNLNAQNSIGFAVSDTGIGIHESKQSLIFEAFQQADGTTSRKYGGTGLGLSISKELAGALGGEIQIESRPGKGSKFTLYLPLQYLPGKQPDTLSESFTPSAPKLEKSEQFEQKEIKIEKTAISGIEINNITLVKDDRRRICQEDKTLLIIEDDPKFCKILLGLAHEKGFKVLVAEDGETGLHFADFYKPSGIILDIALPGIDGWKVMERLKENPETRHIPVHFISVTDKPLDALKMGAVGFLTKPVSIEMLENAFKKIESIVSRPVKKLLIIEDDEVQKRSMLELISDGDVIITAVSSGKEAYKHLNNEMFDCIILDLGLEDMSGFDLLSKIRKNRHMSLIPVIIYTGKELSMEEENKLKKYADSIIIKGARSPERLLDETTLFLHKVKSSLSIEKQKMLSVNQDIDEVLKDKKILVVDDDMRNVFALASVLEEKGVIIVEGRNGREALEKLEQQPDIDLVIMDIMMPEMDGYKSIKKIREQKRFQKIPVIALTAKAMKGDKSKCVEAGANDYLAKPVETGKLLSLLRVWLY